MDSRSFLLYFIDRQGKARPRSALAKFETGRNVSSGMGRSPSSYIGAVC
jgi:hypothetical protein